MEVVSFSLPSEYSSDSSYGSLDPLKSHMPHGTVIGVACNTTGMFYAVSVNSESVSICMSGQWTVPSIVCKGKLHSAHIDTHTHENKHT